MSSDSRSRSRSPMDRKIRTVRHSYRDAPYRRDRRGFSQSNLCKNCKQPGHYARECPNVAICHNCGFPGHIASECTTKSLCWNCREPGHMAGNCPNEGICHTCGKTGHRARDCTAPPVPPGDMRLCNNCFKQGHIAVDCTNDKACKNCRKTGHLARECQNEPVCNLCNVSGHVARECPKSNVIEERGGGPRIGGYRDIICRSCQQPGHMSRDCMGGPLMICHNCGGRGHLAFECPSGRFMDRFQRKPLTFIPVVRNPDGSITRVLHFRTSPPVPDPNSSTTPVLSKDLSLNPLHSTWVRLFLPREALDHSSSSSSSSSSKLPLVVYFHGGGFITCSAATWAFHEFCEKMAIRVRAVIVSVEHRLAPEHRLPAAYDDAMDALHWIKSSPEEWLVNFADYSRCFLMGTSSGGNIAYHAGLRAAAVVDDLKPLKIKGLILHDCYFGGTKRTESELRLVDDPSLPLYYNDLQWELSLPIGTDRDHEFSNPTLDGGSPSWDLFRSLGWRVMITGNDGDPLIGRQVELADALANKGVEVVTHFCQVGRPGQHTLELKDPTAAETFFVIMRNFVYSPVTVSRL